MRPRLIGVLLADPGVGREIVDPHRALLNAYASSCSHMPRSAPSAANGTARTPNPINIKRGMAAISFPCPSDRPTANTRSPYGRAATVTRHAVATRGSRFRQFSYPGSRQAVPYSQPFASIASRQPIHTLTSSSCDRTTSDWSSSAPASKRNSHPS